MDRSLSTLSCYKNVANLPVPHGVAQVAKKYKKPVFCLVGAKGDISSIEKGFRGIYSLTNERVSKDEAMKNASELLEKLTTTVLKDFID